MSHSGSSFGNRYIAVTAAHAVFVFVWSGLQFSVERSGTIDLSRRPKIFVKAATSKSWAKILPRGYISGHLKILGDFLDNIFTHGQGRLRNATLAFQKEELDQNIDPNIGCPTHSSTSSVRDTNKRWERFDSVVN